MGPWHKIHKNNNSATVKHDISTPFFLCTKQKPLKLKVTSKKFTFKSKTKNNKEEHGDGQDCSGFELQDVWATWPVLISPALSASFSLTFYNKVSWAVLNNKGAGHHLRNSTTQSLFWWVFSLFLSNICFTHSVTICIADRVTWRQSQIPSVESVKRNCIEKLRNNIRDPLYLIPHSQQKTVFCRPNLQTTLVWHGEVKCT